MRNFKPIIIPTALITMGILVIVSISIIAIQIEKEKEEAEKEGKDIITIIDDPCFHPIFFLIGGSLLIIYGIILLRIEKNRDVDNRKKS